MADMKKVYDDLIIINLYYQRNFTVNVSIYFGLIDDYMSCTSDDQPVHKSFSFEFRDKLKQVCDNIYNIENKSKSQQQASGQNAG